MFTLPLPILCCRLLEWNVNCEGEFLQHRKLNLSSVAVCYRMNYLNAFTDSIQYLLCVSLVTVGWVTEIA